MQTRKDLYQAHRLMMQRLGMALLQAEPDVPESPMRRHSVATFSGVLVAILVLAIFGIWGLLKPGGATNLTEPGQLLVEEESGATYVFSEPGDTLLPVANYVSARLLLDSANVTTRTVSAASLAKFDRGPLVGIPGAPNSLPASESLVRGPWSACVTEATDAAGSHTAYVTLVGGRDVGGRAIGGDAMVVEDGRQEWLIWGDQRLRVTGGGARALLGANPRTVPAAWLNAIPEGPGFRGPDVPERGRKVRGPDGRSAVVGQVFTVPPIAGSPARWYVLLRDGLAPISITQARLLLEDPESKRQAYGSRPVKPIEIDAATANGAPASGTDLTVAGLPTEMPEIITPDVSAPLCAVYADSQAGSARARLTIGSGMEIPVPPTSGDQEHFDQVLLPPGGAAVAGVLPGDGQLSAVHTYSLITDQGRRFAVASADLLAKLGYELSDVTPVPTQILHLIPEGPVLDPAAARKPLQYGQ
ncbi:type VII secretion protein EccB [Microtetraspora sp. NBRC 16547]|uniref:type VII secretion protein EccB n=1 Tax=Microtetraspora sp. NBRC 16547 TaxID=3030993 RepID=UPI0024A4BE6A|nr:type VII secretion protein EccB [Microtetraspora sp. NBRC 16547]GLW96140.1 type VII secretion protein EccB [Microtetraspora sp. NBRC 16547]